MNDVLNFFRQLPETTGWLSVWQSGHWTAFEKWLYAASSVVLSLSFLILSVTATRFAGQTGKGVMGKLSPVIIWLTLGASAVVFMDVFMLWIPAYRLSSLMRVFAAIASVAAVYKLLKHIPALLQLRPATETVSNDTAYEAAEAHIKELESELKKTAEERIAASTNTVQANELISDLEAMLTQVSMERKKEMQELQQAYDELKKTNYRLEKKAAERTMQMEAIGRELDAFSYAISHDMRAPLRIINGYTDMLHTDYKEVLDAEGRRMLDIVMTNTKHMSGMIDALLTLARIGRKELMILPTDMASIIKSAIGEQVAATNSKATFNIGDIIPVACDSVLLRNVWSNLVSNAIKYTANAAQPEIHIGSQKKEGKVMYFIKDNGMGFNMQYVHKLFGVFQRLHKSTDNSAATGLALVQRVILKHGGYIWAEGEENKGAIFYFTLPENNN